MNRSTKPLTASQRETLKRGEIMTRQRERRMRFQEEFAAITKRYPGESRKSRRSMARDKSKRIGRLAA